MLWGRYNRPIPYDLLPGGGSEEWRDEFEYAPFTFYEDEYGLADPCPYPVKADLRGLVLWGLSSGPEYCFWYADGPDPDTWPVAVYSRSSVAWTQYAGGFAAYLVALFSGGIESPFSFNFPRSRDPEFLYGDPAVEPVPAGWLTVSKASGGVGRDCVGTNGPPRMPPKRPRTMSSRVDRRVLPTPFRNACARGR